MENPEISQSNQIENSNEGHTMPMPEEFGNENPNMVSNSQENMYNEEGMEEGIEEDQYIEGEEEGDGEYSERDLGHGAEWENQYELGEGGHGGEPGVTGGHAVREDFYEQGGEENDEEYEDGEEEAEEENPSGYPMYENSNGQVGDTQNLQTSGEKPLYSESRLSHDEGVRFKEESESPQLKKISYDV